jgi:hypothetical protein
MATDPAGSERGVTDLLPDGKLPMLFFVVGAALLLVPEPTTSVIGALVLLVGVGLWLLEGR